MSRFPEIRGLLIDLDGTLYVGDEAIPGVAQALTRLREMGKALCFITNTTSRPHRAIAEKLTRLQLPISREEILTAPQVAAAELRRRGIQRACFLLRPEVVADMPGIESAARDAQAVVVGDLGAEMTPARLNEALEHLLNGAELFALAENRIYRSADGLKLDVGAYVRALEYGSRRRAILLGKPAPAFFHQAVDALGLSPDEVLSIGDDLESDVGGGINAGLRGVLVRTGKFREDDLRESRITPDAVLDSFSDLPELLG